MKNEDLPAFANNLSHHDLGVSTQQEVLEANRGLTKLEAFAKAAMTGLLADGGAYLNNDSSKDPIVGRRAVEIAKATLAALEMADE